MNPKTMILLGLAGVAAYLLFLRPKAAAQPQSAPGTSSIVGASIAGGTKILGSLLQIAGGSSSTRTSGTGGGSGIVTNYSQIGVNANNADYGLQDIVV